MGVSGRLWEALASFVRLRYASEGFSSFWDALGSFGKALGGFEIFWDTLGDFGRLWQPLRKFARLWMLWKALEALGVFTSRLWEALK